MSKGKKRTLVLLLTALLCLFAVTAMAAGTLTLPKSMKEIKSEAFVGNTSLDEVVLPEGIETIGSRAFAESSVASINLPNSISYIADDAFDGCADLDVMVEQGSYAYGWAVEKGLIAPDLPYTYTITDEKVTITKYTGSDTEVIVPGYIEGYPVTVIGRNAFYRKAALTRVEFPNTLRAIDYYAFHGCSALRDVVIPEGLEYVYHSAFYECTSLEQIAFPNSLKVLDGHIFHDCSALKEVVLPEGLTQLGYCTFYNCTSLEEIRIPSGITKLEDGLFTGCSNLKNIEIPDSVTVIEDDVFEYCSALTSIDLPKNLKSIGDSAFLGCGLVHVTLPNGLESIGDWTFDECENLVSVYVPASVIQIGYKAFGYGSVEIHGVAGSPAEIYAEEEGHDFIADETGEAPQWKNPFVFNYAIDGEFDQVFVYEEGELGFSGTILAATDAQIVDIQVSVFRRGNHGQGGVFARVEDVYADRFDLSELPALGVGDTFDGFTMYLGYDYDVVLYVTDENGNGFESNPTIRVDTYPDSIQSGDYYYWTVGEDCVISGYAGTDIDVQVPDSVDGYTVIEIDAGAFSGEKLENVILPDTVKIIGGGAFSSCRALQRVELSSGVEYIEEAAFYSSKNLKSISIPASVNYIGDHAFESCHEDLTIYGKAGSYAESYAKENGIAFSTGNMPEYVQVNPMVKGFKVNGFSGNLDTYIGDTLEFEGIVTAMEGVLLDEIRIVFASYYDDELTTYLLVEDAGVNQYDLADVPPMVVGETYNGKKMDIENNYLIGVLATDENGNSISTTPYVMVYVDYPTFEDGDYIYTVTEEGCVIDSYTGSDTEVMVPDTLGGYPVVSIGYSAFEYTDVVSVWLPEGVTSIFDWAFSECYSLEWVYIPESVTSIGEDAFYYSDLMIYGVPGSYAEEYASEYEIYFEDASVAFGPELEGFCVNGEDSRVEIAMGETLSLGGVITDEYAELDNVQVLVYEYGNDEACGILAQAENIGASSYDLADLGEFIVGETYNGFAMEAGKEYEVTVEAEDSKGGYLGYVWPIYVEVLQMTEDRLTYEIVNNAAEIIGYVGSASEIEIPAEIDGCPVKRIRKEAFKECSVLTSVVIPDTVEEIGDDAFFKCSNLEVIVVPDSVRSIGTYAFCNCSSLSSFHIPEGIEVISNGMLFGCESLTSVEIPSGIAQIGQSAFYQCSSLQSVVIPDTVTSIGTYAFYGCSSLTGISIPGSVISIGTEAFCENTLLSEVTLAEGIKTIGSRAFANSAITSINLPNSLTSIADNAFDGCEGIAVSAQKDSYAYDWALNNAFIAASPVEDFEYGVNDGEVTITKYIGSNTEVIIPPAIEGYPVSTIGYRAFAECGDLIKIWIPKSVTSIGHSAFYECSSLTSITLPDSVTSIENNAFYGCNSLESVYADSIEGWLGIRFAELDSNPMRYGRNLYFDDVLVENISVPDTVKSIGDYAFYNCSSLTSITIPNSVTSIGKCALYDCSSLTSITIPDGVTDIGRSTFSGCSSLTSITMPDSMTSIEDFAFSGCSSLTSITIPDGVTSIGWGTFSRCSGLTSITIPDGVTSIEDHAFSGCSSLTSITIPDGVTSIGGNAFYNCSSLTSITIPDGVTSIEENTFECCGSLTSITIPDGVTSIGDHAFFECSSLVSITLPDSLTSIGFSAFYECSSLTSITLPDSVTSIGGYALSDCSGLTSITLPDCLTSIGHCAFSDCSSLTSITIPDGVTDIGWSTFGGCSSLTSITLSDSVTSIEDSAFSDCSSLTSIVIPDSVTSIGTYAFNNCSSLTSITIPDGVTSIEKNTFEYCSSLTSITLPDGVTSIGEYAFNECSSLTSITLPDGVTSIGACAFRGCSSLMSITIPDSVTSIGERAFYICSSLISISLPDGVTDIGRNTFGGCSSLTSITLSDSVTSIGYSAFGGCSSLTSITLPDNLTSIDTYAFSSCSSLISITIPGSLTNMGYHAFDSCSGLTSITILDGVKSIGDGAFSSCSGLTSITIPDSVTSIGAGAFAICSSLTSITIPNSVTSISYEAFRACSSLTSIAIPDSVISIEDWGFWNCRSLTSIYIPDSVTWIGPNTFDGCSRSLTIYGVSGSYAESYADEYDFSFVAGEMPTPEVIYPTLTDFTLNATPTELTVPMGSQLLFGGMINAGSAPLVDVQASVFLASDHEQGAVYEREEGINADTYDLSGLSPMTVGAEYNGFAMTAGNSYDVVLYVTDENGKGFASDPYIRVNVVEPGETTWYANVTDEAGNALTSITLPYTGEYAGNICVRTNNGDMTAWADDGFPFELELAKPIELQADGSYLFTYTISAPLDMTGMEKTDTILFCLRDENGVAITDAPLAQLTVTQEANADLPVIYSIVDSEGNNLMETPLTLDYTGKCATNVIVNSNTKAITAWFNVNTSIDFGAPEEILLEDGTYQLVYRNVTANENVTASDIALTCVFYAYTTDAAQPDKSRALAEVRVVQGVIPNLPTYRSASIINGTTKYGYGNPLYLYPGGNNRNTPYKLGVDADAIDGIEYVLYSDNPQAITVQYSSDDGEVYISASENVTSKQTATIWISHVRRESIEDIPKAWRFDVCTVQVIPPIIDAWLADGNERYDLDKPMHLYVGDHNWDHGYTLNVGVECEWKDQEYYIYSDKPESVYPYKKDGLYYIQAKKDQDATIYISGIEGTDLTDVPEAFRHKVCTVKLPTYRALLMGVTYIDDEVKFWEYFLGNADPDFTEIPIASVNALNSMLESMESTNYQVTNSVETLVNVNSFTKEGILQQIQTVLGNATEHDVSLFYFNGHGNENGSLCCEGDDSISGEELRSALDDIGGKKIVILGSCYSGANVSAFNGDDYFVLTACSGTELAAGTEGGELATYHIAKGSGYDVGSGICDMFADTDGNEMISLDECFKYSHKETLAVTTAAVNSGVVVGGITAGYQNVQVYPENSDFVLWAK